MNLRRLSTVQLYAFLVAAAVVAVLLFLIVSGRLDLGGNEDEDPLALPEAAATAVAEDGDAAAPLDTSAAAGSLPAAGGSLRLDQPFQFGDLRVALTDLRLSGTVAEGTDELAAVERFATVLLTVRNTGRAPRSLAQALQLVDADDRLFTPNATATAAAAQRDDARQDALTATLQPGLTVDLLVVFDVSADAGPFRLRLLGGFVDVTLDQ